MEVEIILIQTDGREIRIPGPRCMIGRGDDCHVKILQESVSRRHCAIVVTTDGASVQDLSSRNGTLLNRQRVEGEAVVLNGDVLRIGNVEFEVLIERRAVAKKPIARPTAPLTKTPTPIAPVGPAPKTQVGHTTNVLPTSQPASPNASTAQFDASALDETKAASNSADAAPPNKPLFSRGGTNDGAQGAASGKPKP